MSCSCYSISNQCICVIPRPVSESSSRATSVMKPDRLSQNVIPPGRSALVKQATFDPHKQSKLSLHDLGRAMDDDDDEDDDDDDDDDDDEDDDDDMVACFCKVTPPMSIMEWWVRLSSSSRLMSTSRDTAAENPKTLWFAGYPPRWHNLFLHTQTLSMSSKTSSGSLVGP